MDEKSKRNDQTNDTATSSETSGTGPTILLPRPSVLIQSQVNPSRNSPLSNAARPHNPRMDSLPLQAKVENIPRFLLRAPTSRDDSPNNSIAASDDDELWSLHEYNRARRPPPFSRNPKLRQSSSNFFGELCPKTIRCELYVTFNSSGQKTIDLDNCTHIFEAFEWSIEESYQVIRTKCNQKNEQHLKPAESRAKIKLYLRYGICSVQGPNNETSFNPDTSRFTEDDLHEKAIKEVCRFIVEHTYQRIKLVICCDYGSLHDYDNVTGESNESFSSLMAEQYDEKADIPAKNILDQKYISRADLDHLASHEVSEKLIDEKYTSTGLEKKQLKELTNNKPAQTMLAVCIYQRIDLNFFRHFIDDHDYYDGSLGQITSDLLIEKTHPEQNDRAPCSVRFCRHNRQRLHVGMHMFFAHYIEEDKLFHLRGPDEVVPVSYAGDKRPLGEGNTGKVFEVCVDVTHRLGTFGSGLSETFALKVFHNDVREDKRQKDFRREMHALLHLALFPHDHILTHITSWEQRNNFYILYDRADSDLDEYMKKNRDGRLTGRRIIWFVTQLRGLADAVRKIHQFKDRPAMDLDQLLTPRKPKKTGVVGYHHDIKPKNILVFGKPKHDPILKLCDFGTGKFSRVRKEQESGQATKDAHGTLSYFGPEYPLRIEKSRPFDMWALGCVFMEFLLWFLDIENTRTFADLRIAAIGGDNDPDVVDYYWANKRFSNSRTRGAKANEGSDVDSDMSSVEIPNAESDLLAVPENNERSFDDFELNPAVEKMLSKLEKEWCREMWVFQRIIKQIRHLLEIKPKERVLAVKLANTFDSYLAQTMVDLHAPDSGMDNENNPYARQFEKNKTNIRAREMGIRTPHRQSNVTSDLIPMGKNLGLPVADGDESTFGSSRRLSIDLERLAEANAEPPAIADPNTATSVIGVSGGFET